MISKLIVQDAKLAVLPWWEKVEALKGLSEIRFKEGLNVLWGRNGAGKSTVLTTLAKLAHCDQGGVSVITQTSVGDFFSFDESPKFGIVLEHDAQAVQCVNASRTYGIIGGSFDYDFMEAAMGSIYTKGSSGQVQLHWIGAKLKDRQNWPDVKWKMQESSVNSTWKKRLKQIRKNQFTAQIPPGPRTILFDEPDRSLDLDAQYMLWKVLPRMASEGYQFIVATHSIFARDISGAHYIELSPGYLDMCRKLEMQGVPK